MLFPPLKTPQAYPSSKTGGARGFKPKTIVPTQCSPTQADNGSRMRRYPSSCLKRSTTGSSSSEVRLHKSEHLSESPAQKCGSRKAQHVRPKRGASQIKAIQSGEGAASVRSAPGNNTRRDGKREEGPVRTRPIPMRSTSWQDRRSTVDCAATKQPSVVRHRGPVNCTQQVGTGAQRWHSRNGGEGYRGIQENLASASSSVSSEGTLSRDDFENYWPANPEDVLRQFDLQMGDKLSLVDRCGKHEALGGFTSSAVVSCIGRSNGNWKKENQDTFMIEVKDGNPLECSVFIHVTHLVATNCGCGEVREL